MNYARTRIWGLMKTGNRPNHGLTTHDIIFFVLSWSISHILYHLPVLFQSPYPLTETVIWKSGWEVSGSQLFEELCKYRFDSLGKGGTGASPGTHSYPWNKHARTTPSINSLVVLRPPAAPRDRPRGFLVLASSADALENCELTVTFEALEKPEILEIVDRGMVVNLTLSTQILNWTRKNKGTIVKISKYGVSIFYMYIHFFVKNFCYLLIVCSVSARKLIDSSLEQFLSKCQNILPTTYIMPTWLSGRPLDKKFSLCFIEGPWFES